MSTEARITPGLTALGDGPALPENVADVIPNGQVLGTEADLHTDQTDQIAPAASTEQIHSLRWWNAAKRAGQVAVVATLVSPANEAIRIAATSAAYIDSGHNVGVTALIAGASTFALEQVGGLATAELINTGSAERFFNKVNGNEVTNTSKLTRAIATLFLGSSVGMLTEQAADPSRTLSQNRRYATSASALLAGAGALGGALLAEGASVAIDSPQVAVPAAVGVAVIEVGRRKFKSMRFPKPVKDPEIATWDDSDKYATYHLVKDDKELAQLAVLEQGVWDEKGYGKLNEEGYTEYIENSRTFGAFDRDGNAIGVNRMFGATEHMLPPFLSLDFYDTGAQANAVEEALNGTVEELGTVAVDPTYRGKGINTHLWRQSYRDAMARGVEKWGIIMEPERVERMNKRFGFTFVQMGPAVEYQGGKCAPFIMRLDETTTNMHRKHPLQHFWFVRKLLKPSTAR